MNMLNFLFFVKKIHFALFTKKNAFNTKHLHSLLYSTQTTNTTSNMDSATVINAHTDPDLIFESRHGDRVEGVAQYRGYIAEGAMMTQKDMIDMMKQCNYGRRTRRMLANGKVSRIGVTGVANRLVDERTKKMRERLQKKVADRNAQTNKE